MQLKKVSLLLVLFSQDTLLALYIHYGHVSVHASATVYDYQSNERQQVR